MDDLVDIGASHTRIGKQVAETFEHAYGRIGRSGESFAQSEAPCSFVVKEQVGECTADVDPDPDPAACIHAVTSPIAVEFREPDATADGEMGDEKRSAGPRGPG